MNFITIQNDIDDVKIDLKRNNISTFERQKLKRKFYVTI